MYVLREPPYPFTITFSGDFINGMGYIFTIMNSNGDALWDMGYMGDEFGNLTVELPDYFSRYDGEYRVEIYVMNSYPDPIIYGDLVYLDTLTIQRPYVSPAELAETPEEIAEYTKYEALARAIIDSVTGGFEYKRSVIEATGMGGDFIPCTERVNRVVRAYENNVLVYDTESTDPEWQNTKTFTVTPNKSGITIPISGAYNRYESKPVRMKSGVSDSFEAYDGADDGNRHEPLVERNYSFFASGWDYVFVVDSGWAIIPNDIKQATIMLINDLKCGNNPYFNSYIKEYESDQFTLKFDAKAFTSTGNRLVDKMLEVYPRPLNRLGVL